MRENFAQSNLPQIFFIRIAAFSAKSSFGTVTAKEKHRNVLTVFATRVECELVTPTKS
jgi:hypothetical protein